MNKYDIRHKEILRLFLPQYFKLFFPLLAIKINFDRVFFLDTELLAIVRHDLDVKKPGYSSEDVKKMTDALILVEVEIGNKMEWIMIHWEQQSSKQKDFEERMFSYFCGIYFKYRKLIFPIAMFTDKAVWRKPVSNCYSLSLYDFPIVDYRYQLIKMKDFTSLEFEEKIADNPLAAAYLPLTKYKKSERALIKAKAMQGIATTVQGSDKQAVLLSLIEMSLLLDKKEQNEFKEIINTDVNYEETKMLQSVEELGIEIGMERGLERGLEKGLEKGREEGREEGERKLVLRQLNKKLTYLEDKIKDQITKLDIAKIEKLGEALIDMTNIDDLQNWLNGNSQ